MVHRNVRLHLWQPNQCLYGHSQLRDYRCLSSLTSQPRDYRCLSSLTSHPKDYRCPSSLTSHPRDYRRLSSLTSQPKDYRCPSSLTSQPRDYRRLSSLTSQPRDQRWPRSLTSQPMDYRYSSSLTSQPREQSHLLSRPMLSSLLSGRTRHLTTGSPEDTKIGRLVYVGMLTTQVKVVKAFSVSTSLVGLLMQPVLYQSACTLPPALALALGGMVSFFVLVTPLLLHLVTRRYVTEIHYRAETGQFTAATLTFLLRTRRLSFTARDVSTYDTPRLFATLRAKGTPLFVDPSLFTDRAAGVHMLRYDEPIDWQIPNKPDDKQT